METYDRLYIQFLHEFNVTRDFFECHEVMEELWMEEGRNPFYQGLLQVAVGLYHHENGNISGAIKLFTAGIEKLSTSSETRLGIHIGHLLEKSRNYVKLLEDIGAKHPFTPFLIEILDPDLVVLVEGAEA